MLKILKIATLQYLKENVKHEVGFLPPDKHQRLLQIGSIILVVDCQVCPNYSNKKNFFLKLLFLCNILKEN